MSKETQQSLTPDNPFAGRRLVAATGFLLALVFLADLLLPVNVVVAILYIVCLVPALIGRSTKLLWATVLLGTIANVAAVPLGQPSGGGAPDWVMLVNRALATVALLGTAVSLHWRLRSLARKEALQARLAESLRESSQRAEELEIIYRTVPVGLCVLDTGLRFRRINERMAEINGAPAAAHLGRSVREMVPSLTAEAERLLQQVIRTGTPVIDVEIAGETPSMPGVQRRWVESWLPLPDATGTVTGVSIVAEEVTAQRAEEARRALLGRELQHRIKNTLAVVQVLADQTFGDDHRMDAFRERLLAAGRANDLLLDNGWRTADLREAMHLGVQVADGDRMRITIDGPSLQVPAESVANIALAVHELTTNALKYGALSVPEGQVAVTWQLQRDRLEWEWRESGGPPVTPPAKTGFGSMLIDILATELKGSAMVEYRPEGLRCRIEAEAPRA